MSPRVGLCSNCLRRIRSPSSSTKRYLAAAAAAAATTTTPAAPPSFEAQPPPIARFPRTQPPSHKPPEFRKSQLHRQYTSLLRSTPLLLLFQHSNLKSHEWVSIRRELSMALCKVDETHPQALPLAASTKLQIIQAGIFESALRIAEYYTPPPSPSDILAPTPSSLSPNPTNATPDPSDPLFTHALSRHAHDAVFKFKNAHPLTPLLSGPLAVLTFPAVSPPHLKAALSILAPDKQAGFAAPTRRASPGYYDGAVQAGVAKMMLLGARVEGRVLDQGGVQWVGGLDGMEGLRAQLVALLGAAGANLVGTLEGAGRSVWLTMEGRRAMLEEEGKKEKEGG